MSEFRDHLQSTLGAAYTLDRELPGGGMARVFVAREEALGRDVVVKVLSPEQAEGLSADRFAREIRLAAALQEPHIVPVLTVGTTIDGLPYYTMPFVRGESLRARLDAGPVSIVEAVNILRDVASALAYAHGQGVVHRDVKPENVLLHEGTAVVTDFGIAKAINAAGGHARPVPETVTLTRMGTSLGTPAYMAPEQAAADPATDQRADLYAWGIVAWETLAGRHPFADRTSPHAMVTAHMSLAPAPIASVRADAPPALARIVDRCVEKDPGDRPATATELVRALDESRISGPMPAVARRRPRSRAWLLLVPLLLVAIALVAWRTSRSRAPTAAVAPNARPAVAVLPFADFSPDSADAYLGDGVAERLISALSTVDGIQVMGRTSAFQFRDRRANLAEIARDLGATHVLDGSVQRAGDRLRITAKVVRIADARTIWSRNFDGRVADIFALQDTVARAVVGAFNAQRTRATAARATAARATGGDGTRNPAAYDAYLLGRFQFFRRTTAAMARSIAAFESAIRADSSYASAWAGLADAYSLYVSSEYGPPGIADDSILTLAERAARRAVALDSTVGEAQVSLAHVLDVRDRWADAAPIFERGIALSPDYATGHQWYSYHLQTGNRRPDALREMETARRLEPLAHIIVISLAFLYDEAGRFDDANAAYAQGFALEPDARWSMTMFCHHELARGRRDLAPDCYRRLLLAIGRDTADANATARALADPARRDAMVDALVRTLNPTAAVTLLRYYRSEDAAAAYVTALPDRPHASFNRAMFAGLLGVRLRADARVRAALVRLGYPAWRDAGR